MPETPRDSWPHQLPHMDEQQMEGPETWEREEVDALAQPRDDEHATSLPPAEWHAKWQEDKAKWELERRQWQQHAQRRSPGSESATCPLPSREPAAPEPAVFSPSQPETGPRSGRRRELWEKLSRRPPWNTASPASFLIPPFIPRTTPNMFSLPPWRCMGNKRDKNAM
ncbi:hypothetical protein B0H17DRAFT_1191212 [Mycena rosella]|uniref:Uncharacterized protein n=1 Tax=Mycena rosella TaxID=1033263 RepID=A0AAD7MAZ0_MYCRO|nr:hypothetical protein B0H17DRAFT_1191212 [Mycena rosella]